MDWLLALFSAQEFGLLGDRLPFAFRSLVGVSLRFPEEESEVQGVNIPCRRCGASLPITARFCSRCGTAAVQHFVGSTTASPQSIGYGLPASQSFARTRTLVGTVLFSLLWAVGWTFLVSIILVGLGGMRVDIIPFVFVFLLVGSLWRGLAKMRDQKP